MRTGRRGLEAVNWTGWRRPLLPTAREFFGAALQGGQISRTKLYTRTVTIMKHAHFLGGVSTVQGTLDFYSGGRNEGSVRSVIMDPQAQ